MNKCKKLKKGFEFFLLQQQPDVRVRLEAKKCRQLVGRKKRERKRENERKKKKERKKEREKDLETDKNIRKEMWKI